MRARLLREATKFGQMGNIVKVSPRTRYGPGYARGEKCGRLLRQFRRAGSEVDFHSIDSSNGDSDKEQGILAPWTAEERCFELLGARA